MVASRYFGTANRGSHFRVPVRHPAKIAQGGPMDNHSPIATNSNENRKVLEDVRELMDK
jgi:hypothetical protein